MKINSVVRSKTRGSGNLIIVNMLIVKQVFIP